ncbi:hypothetical protein [Iamia sp.]|uniref:hypothetical protein n=1 Tax=Iamia sp. TaxID=2722710 RepID=UPI002C68B35C|nr:hypothetical protein [Iamia sp.]HXH58555.1 hypothetical protein [Iamia sp.]
MSASVVEPVDDVAADPGVEGFAAWPLALDRRAALVEGLRPGVQAATLGGL